VQTYNANNLSSNFSYGLCVGMMFFDACLYGILAWYLDKTLPSEFGAPLPLWFPFLPSYWFGTDCCMPEGNNQLASPLSKGLVEEDGLQGLGGDEADNKLLGSPTVPRADRDHFKAEPVPADLLKQREDGRCVRIRGLRKVFAAQGGSERVAVNGLKMDMYEGQVTVLLGHNGAGKSTTINMLVGLTKPTSGDSFMSGNRSISRNMNEIRRNLGVCPQHDILFAELTVRQHLQMFASFKGMPNREIKEEVERMVSHFDICMSYISTYLLCFVVSCVKLDSWRRGMRGLRRFREDKRGSCLLVLLSLATARLSYWTVRSFFSG
jgi:ATP-binding cassette subfamily A (ABC1) protein 3